MWRTVPFEVECTVKRGFPVIVRGTLAPSDPSVGIMSEYIEDYQILTRNGKPCPWLKLTEAQENRLLDDVFSLIPSKDDD